MFRTFSNKRWPNIVVHLHAKNLYGTTGICWFSKQEIERRQNLVRAKLKEIDCDLLMAQGHFPPATMGTHTSLYWLSGFNGFRNTITLILPREGELVAIEGVKTSSNPGYRCPYIAGDDISGYIKGAQRIAYDGLGYIGHYFYEYLLEQAPGVQLVDFSDELEQMKAVKSPEEIEAVADSCAIQDRIFAAAPSFLQPGRTSQDITADVFRLLQILGADPTLMPKILMSVRPNDSYERQAGSVYMDMLDDRHYRVRESDYIRLCLETPGSGGYYSERARYFFFDTPHPEIQEMWDGAVALHKHQLGLYHPNVTMKELRDQINAYKVSVGAEPMTGKGMFDTEIRGLGIITVDRPQIQLDWENMVLQPGLSFVSMAHLIQGNKACNVYEMCILTEGDPYLPGQFPLELVVM